jgi:hypothetical protein
VKSATVLAFALALLVGVGAGASRAWGKGVPQLRVIVPRAAVRTGPGPGFRELYRAERGEVMPVVERNGTYWFRVVLPDGRFGWIYGEQVLPFEIDLEGKGASKAWARVKAALFAPSPIPSSAVGFTFSGGSLGGDGMFMFRPGVVLAPQLTVEGFVGESVGDQADVIFAGGGFNSNLFPTSPVTPFAAVAAGGAFGRKKADQFTIKTGNYTMLNVGGGLIVALKKRLTIRGEARHYVIFDANHTQRIQEFSGALSVYF